MITDNLTHTKCSEQLYKEGKCCPACNWFPDMSIKDSNEWKWSEDGTCKVRVSSNNTRVFKCLYDDKPIDWNRDCPRLMELKKIAEEQAEGKENT